MKRCCNPVPEWVLENSFENSFLLSPQSNTCKVLPTTVINYYSWYLCRDSLTSDLKIWSGVSYQGPDKTIYYTNSVKSNRWQQHSSFRIILSSVRGTVSWFSLSLPLKELVQLCPLLSLEEPCRESEEPQCVNQTTPASREIRSPVLFATQSNRPFFWRLAN